MTEPLFHLFHFNSYARMWNYVIGMNIFVLNSLFHRLHTITQNHIIITAELETDLHLLSLFYVSCDKMLYSNGIGIRHNEPN